MGITALDISINNDIIYAKGDKLLIMDINGANVRNLETVSSRLISTAFITPEKILLETGKFDREASLSGLSSPSDIEPGMTEFFIYDLKSESVQKIFDISNEPSAVSYSIHPDGKYILISAQEILYLLNIADPDNFMIYKYPSFTGSFPDWTNPG